MHIIKSIYVDRGIEEKRQNPANNGGLIVITLNYIASYTINKNAEFGESTKKLILWKGLDKSQLKFIIFTKH